MQQGNEQAGVETLPGENTQSPYISNASLILSLFLYVLFH